MYCFCGDAAHDQFVCQGGGLGAGAGKDQGAFDRLNLEKAGQRIGLVRFVDKIVALLSRRQSKRLPS